MPRAKPSSGAFETAVRAEADGICAGRGRRGDGLVAAHSVALQRVIGNFVITGRVFIEATPRCVATVGAALLMRIDLIADHAADDRAGGHILVAR